MDPVHAALKTVDHNRWLAIGLALAVAASLALVSCQPRTPSILDPAKKITAAELEREQITVRAQAAANLAAIQADTAAKLAALQAQNQAATDALAAAQADLQRQIALRQQIIEVAGGLGTIAAGGGLTTGSALGAILQLLALGAAGGTMLDNRRKDAVIAAATAPPDPVATAPPSAPLPPFAPNATL